ncbi:MAG TPA: serine hydrolase, partial [Holophaga sp.]|nr:serine hydrolase [Holophaga sp.]
MQCFSKQLDAELHAIVHDPGRPLASLSVLAMRAGKVVYEGQFGSRSFDASDPAGNRPADQDTLYRAASISKMVAAIGFMKLVEAGQIDLDSDVNAYLDFSLRNPAFPDRPITSRMLLSHTSSLRDGEAEVYTYGATTSLASVLTPSGAHYDANHWAVADASTDVAPGAYFTYTNLNWGILATLMERVSGKRFDLYMREEVLDPLGIQGGYNPAALAPSGIDNLATLYRRLDAQDRWDSAAPWTPQGPDRTGVPAKPVEGLDTYAVGSNGTLLSPQGGLRISVHDLGKVMQMLLQGGTYGGVRILEASTVALMSSEQWRHDADARNGDPYGGQMHSWG